MKWPSSQVRDTFIQYFLRHSALPHVQVSSSSILPRNDPSLAFVNAGMNQFKDIILGLGRPPGLRVTNSQKCLRINDLSLVGVDTYHHTFFEMLGNWSFANYYKAEACQMAWDLLTNVYKLDPNRLYVTYYAGENSIPKDEETKNIWESIGISKERILPFGSDNFWSMGPIGPCGPSTEIHYDHRGTITDPSQVNKDSGNIVEVWNLVFMQYNRMPNGNLERLPLSHVVDTGAGLERLTAVLNNKISNYDTDLFIPIFDTVQKLSNVPKYAGKFGASEADLDNSYRIFADHIRATTIALSDGILPQTNHKIRKLIQRSLSVTEKFFLPHIKSTSDLTSFLKESSTTVASTLSKIYPETEQINAEIGEIFKLEVERFLDAKKSSKSGHDLLPNLLVMDFPSLGRIKKSELEKVISAGVLDGPQAYKWHDSIGVNQEAAEELCNSLGIKFNKNGLDAEMQSVKKGFRDEVAKQTLLNSETNFMAKLESFLSQCRPENGGGICKPDLQISKEEDFPIVQWIFDEDGESVEEVTGSDKKFWIILDKTIFIPGSKTLESDIGAIVLKDGSKLDVHHVKILPSGWILHLVSNIPTSGFARNTKVRQFVSDNSKVFGRELCAQTIKYLQHWLFKEFKVVRFTSGFVSDQEMRLEFTLLKGEVGLKEIRQLQEDLNQYGTPLVITKKIHKKIGEYELIGVTGLKAEIATRNGCEATELLNDLENLCNSSNVSDEFVQIQINSICTELTRCLMDKNIIFPLDVYKFVKEGLEKAKKLLQKSDEADEIKRFTAELNQIQGPFVIKCFESDNEFNSLKKVTRVVEKKPVLVLICSSDGNIQGRCSVPEEMANSADALSAEEWISCITKHLGTGTVNPPKGQNPKYVANLKRVRVPDAKLKLEQALEKAEEYILNNLVWVKELETPRVTFSVTLDASEEQSRTS